MSNSIKDALKKLCLKLTGKKSNKESINGVIDDIADNYEGGSGNLILVEELPEIGNIDTLYKLPNGDIYSFSYQRKTVIVCDLEIGQSFKLVNSIKSVTATRISFMLGNSIQFVENQMYPSFTTNYNPGALTSTFSYNVSNDDNASYNISLPPSGNTDIQLNGSLSEIPDVTITQYFVDNLNGTLEDLMPLFQNSSHKEEIEEATWTKVNNSNLYDYYILAKISDGSDTSTLELHCLSSLKYEDFTEVDTPTITFDDFLNMLSTNQLYDLDGTIYSAINIDYQNKTFTIGGWTSFDANAVEFINLTGRKIM